VSTSDSILTITTPGFEQNGYLVRCGGGVAVVVDPGSADPFLTRLDAEELRLEAVLLTHAHLDHVTGIAGVKAATGAPIYLHAEARQWYDRAADQGRMFGMPVEAPPPPDHELVGGQTLRFGELSFEVRDAPGHAPGHVILYVPRLAAALVGDVVFFGSIGRTDLPGGSYPQLMQSIREAVLTLPDETVLYTGHGPATTVGHERVANPFLAGQYGGELA
jgi:hydroxyacylglutathione hydrolase